MPKPIIDKVSKDIGEVINKPEFSARHLTARSLVPAANTPEQFAADMKRERVVAEKVVKDAGFEPQ
jgi:tripartite-type tricarboxylate transporter receptor subunit TctC